jgi:hypothetical protein
MPDSLPMSTHAMAITVREDDNQPGIRPLFLGKTRR